MTRATAWAGQQAAAGWYAAVAAELGRPSDRTAVDVGCGGAGRTAALAAALGQSGKWWPSMASATSWGALEPAGGIRFGRAM